MQKVIIRQAATGDIEAITRIYADAVLHGTASFEIEPPDQAEMLRRQAALLNHGYPYFAAAIGSVVAGYAYAAPTAPGRLTSGASKIRSMWRRTCTARGSAPSCCRR
jgi:phosphinothricin acetyltransferase